MDFRPNIAITKSFILKRITQEQIFERYLGVEVQTRRQFCNPLRHDKNPTCNFSYHGKKLRFRDWSYQRPLDCFDIVMKMHGLNYDQALKRIASDFDLANSSTDSNAIMKWKEMKRAESKKTRTRIRVRLSDFTEQDREYLTSHGVYGEQCGKFNVKPIDRVWVRGNLIWGYHEQDPGIGYYLGKDEDDMQLWKIYYYRRSSGIRFLCNNTKIQGWNQLPEKGDMVVITKSLKDVMALDYFGIPSIAPQGETTPIPDEKINELKNRFGIVRTLFDFDLAGVRAGQRIRKKHGIPTLFLTGGRFNTKDYGAKDFSDFVKYYGEQAARELIYKQKQKLTINQMEDEPNNQTNSTQEVLQR